MEASEDYGYSAIESQPTQLLQHVLGGATETMPKTLSSCADINTSACADAPNSLEDSEDSATSFSRTSGPKYDYYGLVPTQIDTQCEEYAPGGSQKENEPTPPDPEAGSGNAQEAGPLAAPLPRHASKGIRGQSAGNHAPARSSAKNVVPVTKASVLKTATRAATSSDIGGSAQSKQTKTVSIQSPRSSGALAHAASNGKPLSVNMNGLHKRRRSPSEDSFAGGMHEDAERQFLASSRQFDVPLSELGHSNTEDSSTGGGAMVHSSRESWLRSTSAPAARDYNSLDKGLASNSHTYGRVLVDATPSNSDTSQTPTHQDDYDDSYAQGKPRDVAGRDMPLDGSVVETQVSAEGSDSSPSSSYERLLNGEKLSSQEELAATQPSGSFELGLPPSADATGTTRPSAEASVAQTPANTSSTVPSSGARSLLGMVDPNKQWRIQALQNVAPVVPRRNVPQTPSVIQETQLTEEEDNAAVQRFAVREEVPDLTRKRFSRDIPAPMDMMEIVPDSEPPTNPNPTPGSSKRTKASLRTSTVLEEMVPRTKWRAEHDSGETVPDSAVVNIASTGESTDSADDEEDDVPLAAKFVAKIPSKKPSKGKTKEKVLSPAPRASGKSRLDASTRTAKHAVPSHALDEGPILPSGRKTRANTKQYPVSLYDTPEVPSSAADENPRQGSSHRLENVARNQDKGSAKGKQPRSRSSSNQPGPPAAKRRRVSSSTEEEDTDELNCLQENDSIPVPSPDKHEEEEGTELADDDAMQTDTKPIRTRQFGKRKRGGKVPTSNPRATRSSGRRAESTPVDAHPVKLQSTAPGSRSLSDRATRVFALWKQDGHYYSGTVHSQSSNSATRYTIKFDDGTEDGVDASKLRLLQFKAGDHVIISDSGDKASITDIARWHSHGLISVQLDDGSEVADLKPGDLRIAGRTFLKEWADRQIDANHIVTTIKPKPLKTPSPSKLSLASGVSTKTGRAKALSKTAFVISLSAGNENWEQKKDRITVTIKQHGGTVLDDWSQVLPMTGKHSQGNHRWVIQQDAVQWTSSDDVQNILLLSDDASQKPKFLIALALGVPCISVDWLDRVISNGKEDWQPYLLPAGFSEPLHARVSQMVDLDWGNSLEYLHDIMSNPVASKLLQDKSVLCLGPEFVPVARNKRQVSSDDKAESSKTVPRIILCMGAKRVEAVSERKYASDVVLNSFDYVVVKDVGEILDDTPPDVTCVPFPWVKECLIAGRLLPLPHL